MVLIHFSIPISLAYRQNPTAHPEYVGQVFEDMNRCIERKGWKQVRSPQEQEQVRQAITSELLKQVSRRYARIPMPRAHSCGGAGETRASPPAVSAVAVEAFVKDAG